MGTAAGQTASRESYIAWINANDREAYKGELVKYLKLYISLSSESQRRIE